MFNIINKFKGINRRTIHLGSFIFFVALFSNFLFSSPSFAWRPDMFPPNWQPITDGKTCIEGVNCFFDANGTKDENGATVSAGSPKYHPVRYLHDFSYAGYEYSNKPIPP